MQFLKALLVMILPNINKYDKLKSDEDKRQTSQFLGGMSIFSSVFGVLCAVLSIWAVSSIGIMDSLDSLVAAIFLGLLAIILVDLLLQLIVNGLICAILQMKLNRKPIGLVSLILWFLIVIGAVIIVAVVIF